MDKLWFVVHTYSSQENRVKQFLENPVNLRKSVMESRIGRVIVPTEEVVEMKDGRKTTSVRKFLPSYVLVEMEMTDDTRHFVQEAPGVTGFVGPGRRPEPLREDEVKRILGQIDRRHSAETPEVPFLVGEAVKVIDGPFKDFSGMVDGVSVEKSKVRVMVSIFGRPTPVELDILQVESASPRVEAR